MLDVLNSFLDVIYRLGLADGSELTSSSWVTEAELFRLADDAAERLSREVGLFVTYDNSIGVSAATATYQLPASHVFTIAAALLLNGGSIQILRLTTQEELFALDSAWNQASGPPKRLSLDAAAVGTATLYPNPAAGGFLAQVLAEHPDPVTQAVSTLPLPTVLGDYFSYQMLAGARGKESESAMPEMAAHFRERCRMYEAVMAHLFGPGQ